MLRVGQKKFFVLLRNTYVIYLKTCIYEQGRDILAAVMEHPALVSASNLFKAIPERRFSVPEESGPDKLPPSKWVYLFQREYATVDPALVDVCIFLYSLRQTFENVWHEIFIYAGGRERELSIYFANQLNQYVCPSSESELSYLQPSREECNF